jgi:acetyl esterase/lipase
LDVAYGEADGEELLLDIYNPPARDTSRPAVMLIHGGSWSFGNRTEMADPARHLAEAGYVAFSIDHRLLNGRAPNPWPVQLDDAQRAVRWIRAHAADGVDPERIAAYGWSSGAHLGAMLGVRDTRDNSDPALAAFSSRVNSVVTLGADVDLTGSQTDFAFRLTLETLLGGPPEEQPAAYRDASPLFWVDAEAAPMLIVHGGFDDIVLAEQSQRMVAALYEAEVEAVYAAIPSVGHGELLWWPRFGPLTLSFLQMQLHPER